MGHFNKCDSRRFLFPPAVIRQISGGESWHLITWNTHLSLATCPWKSRFFSRLRDRAALSLPYRRDTPNTVTCHVALRMWGLTWCSSDFPHLSGSLRWFCSSRAMTLLRRLGPLPLNQFLSHLHCKNKIPVQGAFSTVEWKQSFGTRCLKLSGDLITLYCKKWWLYYNKHV